MRYEYFKIIYTIAKPLYGELLDIVRSLLSLCW